MALSAALIAGTIAISAPASADTVPVDPTETATVSSDFLPTAQVDGVVWSQAVVGDTVYAGGSFAKARPAGAALGVNDTTRTHLLAYSISTGVLNPTFAPTLNGQVLVTALSPDNKRLYVGGDFTVVNGVTRNRVAAFDTATGALLSFNPNANKSVRAITAVGDTVYIGGDFTAIKSTARTRVAAVTASTTALLPWAPAADFGSVHGIVQSPDATKVALGGRFTSLNGSTSPGYGLGMVSSASSGDGKTTLQLLANSVVRDAGPNGAILSLVGDADSFYAGGYDFGSGANFEGIVRLRWSDGGIIWMQDCHGDTYQVYAADGLVYDSSHAHSCSTVPGGFPEVSPRVNHQAIAFTKDVKGKLTKPGGTSYQSFLGQPAPAVVNWFPSFVIGSYTGQNQATWAVTGNSQYVIFGGEFIAVNGKPQQGLSRFAQKAVAPNLDGPRLTGAEFVPTATSTTPGTVTLNWKGNWDRDNELLTYQVIRDGNTAAPVATLSAKSRVTIRPSLTFTDTGLAGGSTHTYQLIALDPFGNAAAGDTITATALAGSAANAAPTASFTSTSNGLEVALDGSASADVDGTIASYSWNYGDATANGSGVTSSHTYAAAGTYDVTLTVTDDKGAVGTKTTSVTVAATPPVTGLQASDSFSRTVTGGFGSADAGGLWTTSGAAANFSVAGGVGRMSIPTAGQYIHANLGGGASSSTDLTVKVTLAEAVQGGSAYVIVKGRVVGADDYRTRLVIATNGSVVQQLQRGSTTLTAVTVPGLTYTAGDVLNVRLQVFGTNPTTIRSRTWAAGTTEPTTWVVSRTDSTATLQNAGTAGLGFYLGSTSTALPRTVTFDDLLSVPTP